MSARLEKKGKRREKSDCIYMIQIEERKMNNKYVFWVDFARTSPPFLPHAINGSSPFYCEVIHAMEVYPFMCVVAIPDIGITWSNDGAEDL